MSNIPAEGKQVANLVYHGAVLSALTISLTMLAKKVTKIKPADIGHLNIEDGLKLTVAISGALATQDMLIRQGILPGSIVK